jgi:CDP-diacylglycerol--glycerol-3-phosphate 3-phosphatidyltransferase
VIVLAVISDLAGVLGPAIGASRRYDGPMGKSDRAFVFGALGLWVGVGGALPAWAAWLMPVVAALLVVTIVNRVRRGLAENTEAAR